MRLSTPRESSERKIKQSSRDVDCAGQKMTRCSYGRTPAVWQYISVDNIHCVHLARSCINFAYNFQNLYNDIKNKNGTLRKGGWCNIITNLHPCKTHPFLLCTDMCGWSTHSNLSLSLSCLFMQHLASFISGMLVCRLWVIMIQILKLLSSWVLKLDRFCVLYVWRGYVSNSGPQ